MPTRHIIHYRSGLYMENGEDRARVTATAKTKNLVVSFALFFAACNARHVEYYFSFMKFDSRDSGFIVSETAPFEKETDKVGLIKLIKRCGHYSSKQLRVLKRTANIDLSLLRLRRVSLFRLRF